MDVSTKRLEAFIAAEEAEPGKRKKSAASINRELAALRGAFNLARKQGQISRVPYFPMLREDNARQGFFEKDEFEKVAAALPVAVADVARFAYLSGWRKGEILPLTWENVDRAAGEVRIVTSKNGHGRMLPLTGALKELIERRWQAREYLTREKVTAISPHVFHEAGVPVGDFRKAWASACETGEGPGKVVPRPPPHGGSEHDPRWRSSDRRHVDQRAPDGLDVQSLQHHLERRQAGGAHPDGSAPRARFLPTEISRPSADTDKKRTFRFPGTARVRRRAFEVLLRRGDRWCAQEDSNPQPFDP